MQRCFELARHGQGVVAPNPLVGSVVVANGEIIGEGWHRGFGLAHAEVNAIASVANKERLSEATLYVNLEPCAHYGKTPPCANLIVEMGIPHVVIANRDPFDAVNGKGIEHLTSHGVKVELGVEDAEGRELNKHFFTFNELKRPYILLKWAQTKNGILAPIHPKNEKHPTWISHPATRKIVHQWRVEHPAILVGWRTVENDNPELTARDVVGRSPVRVVLDPNNRLKGRYKTFNGAAPSLVFSAKKPLIEGEFDWVECQPDALLTTVARVLYERKLNAVMVEGGATTLNAFLDAGLWDEARIITGQAEFSEGIAAPRITATAISELFYAGDQIRLFKRL